ncbi:hypothetical protein F5X96DRAFT_684457 [Biscogniauxia mediterranea]|nr:hypothetical protein F5X96DRAFT_684457 [Biscogniauxia mediterranea]
MSNSTKMPSAATSKTDATSSVPATSTSNRTKTTLTGTAKDNSSKNNTTASNATTSNTAAATTSTAGSTTQTNDPSSSSSTPPTKSVSFPTSPTIKTPTATGSASAVVTTTSTTTTATTQLQIPSSQSANAELGRQVPNHQKYLCYELAAYHICGHPSGETSLLLSRRHAQALGYGAPCTDDCAVDSSRRVVLSSRCGPCATAVPECLAVALKHACGHLAGVQTSAGTRHAGGGGGEGQRCDAYCRAVQVDADVGGACRQCTWSHCCMVFGRCRCGHRDGVVAARVLGAQHVLNFGTSRAPCDARCHFRHKDRVVGDYCARCKPLVTPMTVAAPPVMAPPLPLPALPPLPPPPPPVVDPMLEPEEELRPPSPLTRAKIGLPRGAPRWMYYENMRW